WTKCGLDGARGFTASKAFAASVADAYRFGFEFIPNRNDIKYMRTVAYRFGAYHKNDYFLLDGKKVAATGITLGVTLPIYIMYLGGYNGVTLGVDFGQRGSVSGSMIRERYINFSIGVNLYDHWFQKFQYQ
ncbi:MAG: hypothetical protein J6N50_08040, partial [Bacteroidales bacterium]|nr:hypothetical protein [Bacteroidales bacterium]